MGDYLDDAILSLLRCPNTGAPLESIRDPAEIERYGAGPGEGHYRLASGTLPEESIDSLLVDPTGRYTYPVVAGIPLLAKGSHLIRGSGPAPRRMAPDTARDDRLEASFQAQMAHYSRIVDHWYGDLIEACQAILREHYYPRCAGMDVLDVGNGGASAEKLFGPDLAATINRFIGVDKSYPMLSRLPPSNPRILGNAAALPFADGAVDYVLVNGVIHHLGLKKGTHPKDTIGPFLQECLRVCHRGVIHFELIIPRFAELAEHLVLMAADTMATFVYSQGTLLRTFREMNLELAEPRFRRIDQMIPPLTLFPPILTKTWMRVPAGVVPYRYLYGFMPKDA